MAETDPPVDAPPADAPPAGNPIGNAIVVPIPPHELSNFNTGLYRCFSSCFICTLGCFCPCALYADNHFRLHGSGFYLRCFLWLCCCWCLRCFFGATTRRTLRYKYAIREAPHSDFCVHFWCPLCAICQETRELQYRGTLIPPTLPAGAALYPQQPGFPGPPGQPMDPQAAGMAGQGYPDAQLQMAATPGQGMAAGGAYPQAPGMAPPGMPGAQQPQMQPPPGQPMTAGYPQATHLQPGQGF